MKNKNGKSKTIVRKNRKRRNRRLINFCIISLIAFAMFFAGFKISAITAGAKSLDTDSYNKMYKSVMVERNDSIWDIAERYMGIGYTDTSTYVDEIISLNNLSGPEIHFGEYICVPYYG